MPVQQTAKVITLKGYLCDMIDGKTKSSREIPVSYIYTDQSIDYISTSEVPNRMDFSRDQLVHYNCYEGQACYIINQKWLTISTRVCGSEVSDYNCKIIAVVSGDGTNPIGITRKSIVRFADDLQISSNYELPSYLHGFEFIGCVQGNESFYIRKSGDIYIIRCDQILPNIHRCSRMEVHLGNTKITKLDIDRVLIFECGNKAAIVTEDIDKILELSRRASVIVAVPNMIQMRIGIIIIIITDLTSRPILKSYCETKNNFLPILP